MVRTAGCLCCYLSILISLPDLRLRADGEINFSDFVYMVSSYCFFEPVDILKCKRVIAVDFCIRATH